MTSIFWPNIVWDNNLILYQREFCGGLFYLETFRNTLKSIFVSVMHQHRQADGWCVFLLAQRARDLHSRLGEVKRVTAVITSKNTAQLFGRRFWLKKLLYPS